jgi:acetoacetyl-CoA synthetase
VKLKTGSGWPPIFIAPGLDGRASFSSLAKGIQTGNPVYGIQAKGLDGMDEPLDRVQDMAQFYLAAIKELQSHGPYILIGYSFGGLVALEIAQSLSQAMEEIALLVMIDAYPDSRYMKFSESLRLSLSRMKQRVLVARQKSARATISYLIDGLASRMRRAGVLDASPAEGRHLSLSCTTARVKHKSQQALAHYRPRPYRGKIKFVKNESDPYFPCDPIAALGNFATELEVNIVPGDHVGMVTAHSGSIAAVVTGYLRESFGNQKG